VARQRASRNSGKTEDATTFPGQEDRRLLTTASAIIGIDEVGRGALAGPLVVAGVRFTSIPENSGIRDSKKLTARRRESLVPWISRTAESMRLVEIWPWMIDRINILEATRFAMRRIVDQLVGDGDVVVVDAVDLGKGYERVLSPIKADDRFFSVAAASIVAKVHRDLIMKTLGQHDPEYDWKHNKGYPTLRHRKALGEIGPSPFHRRSFRRSPVLP